MDIILVLILLAALIASSCALRLHRHRAPFTRWLLAWVFTSTAAESIGFLSKVFRFQNVHYYNTFVLVEFFILIRIAMLQPVGRWLRPPLVHVLLIAYSIIWAIDMYTIGGKIQFAMHAFLFGTPILVAIYLLLLWHLVNDLRGPLTAHPPFWLYLTVLLFYGTVAPLLGSVNYLYEFIPQPGRKIQSFISFMSIVKFVLLSIACLSTPRQEVRPA